MFVSSTNLKDSQTLRSTAENTFFFYSFIEEGAFLVELTLWTIQPVQGKGTMAGSCWAIGTHLRDHLFCSVFRLFVPPCVLCCIYISDWSLFSELNWSFYFFLNVVFPSSMFWFFFPFCFPRMSSSFLFKAWDEAYWHKWRGSWRL